MGMSDASLRVAAVDGPVVVGVLELPDDVARVATVAPDAVGGIAFGVPVDVVALVVLDLELDALDGVAVLEGAGGWIHQDHEGVAEEVDAVDALAHGVGHEDGLAVGAVLVGSRRVAGDAGLALGLLGGKLLPVTVGHALGVEPAHAGVGDDVEPVGAAAPVAGPGGDLFTLRYVADLFGRRVGGARVVTQAWRPR